jgi:erythromycin esterase-like protein
MKPLLGCLAALIVLVAAGDVTAQQPPVSGRELDAVVHDLCDKSVALLGESPLHAFGHTLELKSELVRRLVTECHYNVLLVESGIYDWLNLQKRPIAERDAPAVLVATAFGGLWASQEVQPLFPFLVDNARSGKLILGGIDDQVGRGSYAQAGLTPDVLQYLDASERAQCSKTLERHMRWQYTSEAPYDRRANAAILSCLEHVGTAIGSSHTANAALDAIMVRSLMRSFRRDFPAAEDSGSIQRFNARDRSMYENFAWYVSWLPAGSKIMVWAATTHIAKTLATVPGQEAFIPLGSYIHRDYGSRAFAVGFSAYAGTYGMPHQAPRELLIAPDSTLEARALARTGAPEHYLGTAELEAAGVIAARPTGAAFTRARWSEALDGLVVLRKERPVTP